MKLVCVYQPDRFVPMTYIVGWQKTRLMRLLNAMLWVFSFLGGKRPTASRLSDSLMYRLPLDSGRSGNVN